MAGTATPAPIVLVHGVLGFSHLQLGRVRVEYFRGLAEALRARGHPVIVATLPPTGPVAARAEKLRRTLAVQFRRRQLRGRAILIAHSMGGLDARLMLAQPGMAERVAALLTICTPHRGSPYADWCLENLGRKLGGLKLAAALGLDARALEDLTVGACARFNRAVPDQADVRYFSVSAARGWRHMAAVMLHARRVVRATEGENDGVVSVASAQWGEHLGTWAADHLHAINLRLAPDSRPPTGDIVPHYLRALERMGL